MLREWMYNSPLKAWQAYSFIQRVDRVFFVLMQLQRSLSQQSITMFRYWSPYYWVAQVPSTFIVNWPSSIPTIYSSRFLYFGSWKTRFTATVWPVLRRRERQTLPKVPCPTRARCYTSDDERIFGVESKVPSEPCFLNFQMLLASFSFFGLCYLNSAVLGFFYVFSFSRFIGACVFFITIIGPVYVAFLLKAVTFWALLFRFCACVAVVFLAVFQPPCLTFLRLGLVLLKGALNCCTIFFISLPMLRHQLASVAMRWEGFYRWVRGGVLWVRCRWISGWVSLGRLKDGCLELDGLLVSAWRGRRTCLNLEIKIMVKL